MGAGETDGRWNFAQVGDLQIPAAEEPVTDQDAESQGVAGQRLHEPADAVELQDERADDELSRGEPQAPAARADATGHVEEDLGVPRQRTARAEDGDTTGTPRTATAKTDGGVALRGDNGTHRTSDIQLWDRHPDLSPPPEVGGMLAVARTKFGDSAIVDKHSDGATAFLAVQSGQVARRSGEGGRSQEVVPTGVDHAREHPASLERMIIHRPKGEFERRLEEAERSGRVDAFEQRLGDYAEAGLHRGTIGHDGKEVPGFWRHLHWTDEELDMLKYGAGIGKHRARVSNDTEVGKVQIMYSSNFNVGDIRNITTGTGEKREIGAGTWVSTARTHIMGMDTQIKRARVGHRDGMSSPAGSPYTQGRLEHLLALELPHVVGRPSDGEDAKDPDQMKLDIIKKAVDREWAEAKHQILRGDRGGYTSGDTRLMGIPEHLQDLMALKIALEVRYASGDAEKAAARANGILEYEKTAARLIGDARGRQDPQGHISGNQGEYGQEDFDLDVLEANVRYHNLLQGPDGIRRADEHLARAVDKIHGKIAGRARAAAIREGRYDGPDGLFDEDTAALLGPDEIRDLLTRTMGEVASAQATRGVVPASMRRVQRELVGRLHAADQDLDGSYRNARRGAEARIAREQLAQDRPPQGRRLIYVGDTRREDGRTGLLEMFSLLGGNDQYLDSAGNTPLLDPTFRSDLQATAHRLDIPTVVEKPLERIVEGRQWENVHYVGRMPKGFTADHILAPIMPGGLGTVEVEPNAVNIDGQLDDDSLIRRIMREIEPDPDEYNLNPSKYPHAYQFRVSVVPTRVLRVLRDPASGGLGYSLDHEDERLASWEEHTLALFRNNSDGSPSALYEHLSFLEQEQAVRNAHGQRANY